jgi:ribosomal protein S13
VCQTMALHKRIEIVHESAATASSVLPYYRQSTENRYISRLRANTWGKNGNSTLKTRETTAKDVMMIVGAQTCTLYDNSAKTTVFHHHGHNVSTQCHRHHRMNHERYQRIGRYEGRAHGKQGHSRGQRATDQRNITIRQ